MMRHVVPGLVIAGLMCILVAGCGSKVSKSNYDKINNGMTVAEVEGILGKGTEQAGGAGALGNLTGSARIIAWTDEGRTITVTFLNDKVTAKAQTGL